MKLIVLGNVFEDLPDLPDEFTQILVSSENPQIVEWALESIAPVVLVAPEVSALSDEILDELSEVVESDDPDTYIVDAAVAGDLAFITWEDTPVRYRQLTSLLKKNVAVLDMADGYQELAIEDTADLEALAKELTTRITADVLKTVRAEMQEMLRSRRFRSSGPKV